jgi:two-component system, OmpR family, copper resistance phosphate regulon response regulator CusR
MYSGCGESQGWVADGAPQRMRLLVVEDEAKAAEFLRKGLSEGGLVVDVAADGVEGLFMACHFDYDLVVLDAMLPGKDGWTVLAELRRLGRKMPVLFLTARSEVNDRVRGLDLGADDYLVKPFAFTELLARVRALLRRRSETLPEVLAIADLRLDLHGLRAEREGTRLELAPKEFALLSLLVRRKGEVLSRRVIAEQVWDINFDSDSNVVDVAVRRLRRKVDDPFIEKLIHTVRGMGYVLERR